MTDTITRCPMCATSFRISAAHLKSAKGSVRCGSCLGVFNAKEHIVSAPKAEAKTATKVPRSEEETLVRTASFNKPQEKEEQEESVVQNQALEGSSTQEDDDDLLISDDMDDFDEIRDTEQIQLGGDFNTDFSDSLINAGDLGKSDLGKEEVNLFERGKTHKNDEEELPTDESWALDLLNDDTPLPRHKEEETEEDEDNYEEAYFADEEYAEAAAEEYGTGSFKIIDDETTTSSSSRPKRSLFEASDPEYALHSEENFDESDYPQPDRFYHSDYESDPYESDYERSDYLSSIEPEPVEFAWHKKIPFWYSRKAWGIGALVLSFLLVLQLAIFEFDHYSRIEPYRSYYKTACANLKCSLPSLQDLSKIRAANVVVRSHPGIQQALVVDAVLQNNAAFPQSFPAIDLTFSDIKDEPVAARRFTPKEYLGGELAGSTNMPSKQPIHIALEIVDPGRNAVNYRIQIAN